MIARIISVLSRQIYSGNASLYLSVIGSMLVAIAILDWLTLASKNLSYDITAIIFYSGPFLFLLSLFFAQRVVFESPISRPPKPVQFRLAIAACIGLAATVSWFIMLYCRQNLIFIR